MDCPARCLRSGRSIIEPYADTVGTANAVIDDAVLAAAADSRDVGRRRVEGVVDRAIKLDMVVPTIRAAEVAIDHRRHIVVVYAGKDSLALGQVVGQHRGADDAGLPGDAPRAFGIGRG